MHYFRQGHQQRPIGRKAGLVLLILERVEMCIRDRYMARTYHNVIIDASGRQRVTERIFMTKQDRKGQSVLK